MKRYTFNQVQLLLSIFILIGSPMSSQLAMNNVASRNITSLNGKWDVIIDPTGIGDWRKVWQEIVTTNKSDFKEYSFKGGPQLMVPGDFNTQLCELTYYEGVVWYQRSFNIDPIKGKRLFLHFGAVNYVATVYLNGHKIGAHEGGFTPFQFEITEKVHQGENRVVVKVDNSRLKNGLPAFGYDWFNYGGITRDVSLIETNNTYIDDYLIQLKKESYQVVEGWVKMKGTHPLQTIDIQIPELEIKYRTKTNEYGIADFSFSAHPKLWKPNSPKLYKVVLQSEMDTIVDEIGFRHIEANGSKVMLNGKEVFFKAVNIHEENPLKAAKAYSESDAHLLLSWAKELGCNMVRLAHYPHNEHMVKMAEKMGLMVWEELPIYQHIEFSDTTVEHKMDLMLREMIKRDRNRCGIVIWSLSNETYSSTPNRDKALIKLGAKCKHLDPSRLTTTVMCTQGYSNNEVNVWDTLYRYFDIMSINEYIGWYVPWQGKPEETKWIYAVKGKPVFISEFGGEALYGSVGPADEAAYWTEAYQATIYKDQLKMFDYIPNLSGVCPWLLVDYRSLGRMNQQYQKGWNRKGLLSDKGEKKQAWYLMRDFFK